MNLSNYTTKGALLYSILLPWTFFAAALLLLCSTPAQASVSGYCSDCHTMHNSQDGSMVYTGGPGSYLLVNDCVGCHTSTTNDSTITTASTTTPIVFNTVAPAAPLAGGNFYWVVNNGDAYGHNVRGIKAADVALAAGAPGSFGCVNSCHVSLTLPDATAEKGVNGCRGCHFTPKHHGTDPSAGTEENAASGWYRFLVPPDTGHIGLGGNNVRGIEDSDWEETKSNTDHNIYYKGDGTDSEVNGSLSAFCAGCHKAFHSTSIAPLFFGVDNGGGANPWLRHPADYAIPSSGEYASMSTTYDPLVPVAKDLADTGNFGNVVIGTDKVMCISCHRAHGSPYPDMLRWDYTLVTTDTTGSMAGNGCFKCHTAKDGV